MANFLDDETIVMTREEFEALDNDFDDEPPTQPVPAQTMRELVFGEGHAPAGPHRPTLDLWPVTPSDGVPVAIEDDANTERMVRS